MHSREMAKRMSLRLFSIVLVFASIAAGETFLDSSYRKIYEAFSGKSCENKPTASINPNCYETGSAAKNLSDLNQFSESQFFSRLSTLEIERLECGMNYWKSLSNSTNNTFLVELLNEKIPQLNKLRKTINDLNVRNALLQGKSPNNTYVHQQNLSDPYKPLREEYEINNLQIKKITELYEMIMAAIPHSDIPVFRDFIEEKASTSGLKTKEPLLISTVDLNQISQKIKAGFSKNIQDLNSKKSGTGVYNLNESQREQLGTDSFLVSQLIKEQPGSLSLIEKYKCQVLHKQKGKEGLWDGVSYLGTALSLGGPAILGVARLGWVSRASTLAQTKSITSLSAVSRMASYSALFTGLGTSFRDLTDQCFKSDQSKIVGSCEQTPQTLFAQKELSNCLLTGSLLAMTQGYGPIDKIMKMNSSMAKAIGDVKIGSKLQGRSAAVDLATGTNKLRLEADALAVTKPTEAAKKYKEALLGSTTKKEYSARELQDMEYLSSRWGSLASDAKDAAEAEKKYIEAFKNRLNNEYEVARKNKRNPLTTTSDNYKDQYIQDYIDFLKSDKGKDSHLTTTNWQINALQKFLRNGMK